MKVTEQLLQSTDLFQHASASSRTELLEYSIVRQVKKGSHLFIDRKEGDCLYLLLEGVASLYKINSLGEKKVIFTYGAGNLLNEEIIYGHPESINCELLEDSLVLAIPMDRFTSLLTADSGLMMAFFDSMALKIRRMYRQLKNTTNALNGEKRLAAKLYKLAKDYGEEKNGRIVIQLNLTITYLAEMMGSKRETVSRQMKQLVKLGLIETEKNRITVPDLVNLSNYFKAS